MKHRRALIHFSADAFKISGRTSNQPDTSTITLNFNGCAFRKQHAIVIVRGNSDIELLKSC